MKKFKLIYVLIGLVFLGCSKDDISTIGQQGNYLANFDFPIGELAAPAKVVLTNRSKNADKFHWEYAGGKTLTKSGLSDVTESEKMVPDTIYYQLPGVYTVKLTSWQGDKKEEISKTITLKKMQPRIKVPENIAVFEDAKFDAAAFIYPGKDITYLWDFGTAGTSTLKSPTVKFTTEGPRVVKLKVNDGVEEINVEVTVQVKGELAKTIYFTDVITKKIYRFKLTTLSPSQVLDLGVTTGVSPLGLSIAGTKLFYSEAGNGLRFTATTGHYQGDGYLKSFNLDGTGEKLITKNMDVSTTGYNVDPWMNMVDKDGNIWWTTRTNGVFVMNSTASEAVYPTFKFRGGFTGYATTTHFYSGIKEVNDEVWVSLTGTAGLGIARYTKAGVFIELLPGAIKDHGIRQFAVDKVNGHIYFAVNKSTSLEPGIYRSDLTGNNIRPIYNEAAVMGFTTTGFSDQGYTGGNSNESIYVTGMDIDVDATGKGYLYFGYRNKADASGTNAPQTVGSGAKSGIMRYKLDGTQPVDFLLKGYAPYGLAIDQVKR
uniref:PKD domain-containing protein n=1 Tax=Pedobacter schmidteae TaxID=2201271 RepID=UPI000EB0ECE8|nr:PKD domain-containing protein [Pedobacter schmidteae]